MARKTVFHSCNGKIFDFRFDQWKVLTESFSTISWMVCSATVCPVLAQVANFWKMNASNKNFSIAPVENWSRFDFTIKELLSQRYSRIFILYQTHAYAAQQLASRGEWQFLRVWADTNLPQRYICVVGSVEWMGGACSACRLRESDKDNANEF